MLALLSPCSALLLPAYFASTVSSKLHLFTHGAVFYLGLVATLVPFGLGLGALGAWVTIDRHLIVLGTSVLLVVLGIAQALNFGFDLSRLVPGMARLHHSVEHRSGLMRTLLLGAVGGVAGFCAGPILGAILTLAFTQTSLWNAGLLLAVYGAGMVAPLLLVALFWRRLGTRGRRILRGRSWTVLGRELHSTSIITGMLIIGTGVVFWMTNGLVGLPSALPTESLAWLQERGAVLASPLLDVLAILLAASGALLLWSRSRRRYGAPHDDAGDAAQHAPSNTAAPSISRPAPGSAPHV